MLLLSCLTCRFFTAFLLSREGLSREHDKSGCQRLSEPCPTKLAWWDSSGQSVEREFLKGFDCSQLCSILGHFGLWKLAQTMSGMLELAVLLKQGQGRYKLFAVAVEGLVRSQKAALVCSQLVRAS